MNRYTDIVKKHLAENFWIYSVIVFFFILGICIGALSVNQIDAQTKNELKTYIDSFLNTGLSNQISNLDILKQSIKLNLYSVLFVALFGFTLFGILAIPLFCIFRGFCIGFTVAFLTDSMGTKGFLFSLISILPQNLIYFPAIIALSVCCISFSLSKIKRQYHKNRIDTSRLLLPYALMIALFFVLLLSGSIIEAYLTTSILKYLTVFI